MTKLVCLFILTLSRQCLTLTKYEKARILQGLTKGGLAEQAGIHPTTYTLILKGSNHHPPTIKKVADALGLKMEEIYIEEEAKSA